MTTATLTRTDREIQADVLAELRWDNSIPGTEIGVAVKDGVVTLTGTVDTFLKKWRAEEDAHKVNRVMAVAYAVERGSELDEQIFRLQCLVCQLLEKNEELRQGLVRQASGKEGQRFIGQRSGVH
jgi:hypothetical protein